MVEIKHETFGSVGNEQIHTTTPNNELNSKPNVPLSNKAKPNFMEPLTLQSLIELGRVQEKITISNRVFEIATLTENEQATAYEMLKEIKEEDGFFNLRKIIVASSIISINGAAPETFIEDDIPSIHKRIKLVSLLQGSVVEKLYEFYNKLLEKSQATLNQEQVKN